MNKYVKQTTEYFKQQGGDINMKLKHILVSSLMGLALLSFQPSFVNAEVEPSLQDPNIDTTIDTVQFEVTSETDKTEELHPKDTYHHNEEATDEENDAAEDHNSANEELADEEVDESTAEEDAEESTEEVDTENSEESTETEEDKDSSEVDEEPTVEEEEELEESEKDESNTSLMKSSIQNQTDLSSKEIVQLKKDLTKLGFGNFPNKLNSNYDYNTRKAIKDFHRYYGLSSSDQVNQKTLHKINKILSSPFQNGRSDKKVIQLKKDLKMLGFKVSNNPTRLYGSKTESVVKNFQKENDLVVNGIADTITLEKIKTLISTPLEKGMRRQDVITLKSNLKKLGFRVPGNGTNLYGTQTEKRVKEFQRYYGLRVDGKVDNNTKKFISEIVNTPLQRGKSHRDTVKLKKDLGILGFKVSNNPTRLYGSKTKSVVKDFQRKNNLVVNGIADTITLEKIKTLISTPLEKGMRRQDVITLKSNLKKLGFRVPGNGTSLYGTQTERKVKEFQRYYGLRVDGKVNNNTKKFISEIVNTPLQRGKSHRDTIKLKKNLKALGFKVSNNPTRLYGSKTKSVVKEFQRYYNLIDNGIADKVTLEKINSMLNGSFSLGKRNKDTIKLKKDLATVGFKISNNPTNLYGSKTMRVVKDFQKHFGLAQNGIADNPTLNKINSILSSPLQKGKRHQKTVKLKKDLQKIGFKVSNNPTRLYGSKTESVVKDFQRAYGLPVSGIADEITLNKIKNLAKKASKVKIFIDPGHGGHDSGASRNGLQEKNLTLDIAKEIERLLKQYKDVEIKMARSTDEYLKLKERTNKANNWGANFFLSVHINAGGGTGIESYIHNKNATADEKKRQNIIHDHLMNGLKGDNVRDRGKKKANFHVLRESKMSALLVEYMFIDNSSDVNKLKSTPFKNKLARLTAEGVAKSFNLKK